MSYTSTVFSNGVPSHQHQYGQHRGAYNQQPQHTAHTAHAITNHSSAAAHASTSSPAAASAQSATAAANQPLLPAVSLASLLQPTAPPSSSASAYSVYAPPSADVLEVYSRYFAACRTRELTGHRKPIRCVRWNSTGTKLASGSGDGSVRVYSLQTAAAGVTVASAEGAELKGHSASAEFVCFNPSRAEQLASASLDGTVRIWDTATGRCTATVSCPGDNITLAWTRCGATLAVGNKDNAITLVDARSSFAPLATLVYAYEINELEWSAPQQPNQPPFLLASTSKAQVEVIDAAACIARAKAAGGKQRMNSLPPVVALDNHAAPVYALATSADGQLIASGSTDAVVVVRDTSDLAPLCTLLRFDSPIRSVSFGQAGRLIAVGTEGGELEIAMVDCHNSTRLWHATLQSEVVSVAFNPVHPLLAYSTDSTERYSVHLFGCA